jgi:hypothetical protein
MFGNLGQGLNMDLVTAQMQPSTMDYRQVAPADQQTMTLRMAPSDVATRTIGPASTDAGLLPATPGGSTTFGPGPSCLTAAQVALIVNCAANPSADCAALVAASGMPLCSTEKLPLPSCRDDQIQAGISYCDQYGPSGPDPVKNAVCWAATKDPAWYAAMKGLPPCPGSDAEKKKKMLMWGGILLGVAVVGGVGYWYATKKK